jgi:hypothetical protein
MPQVFFRDVAHYFPPRVKRELVPTPTRKPKGRTLSTTEPALVPSFPSSRSSSHFLGSQRNFVIDHRIDKDFCTKFQRNLGGVVFGGNQRANFRRFSVNFVVVVFFFSVCLLEVRCRSVRRGRMAMIDGKRALVLLLLLLPGLVAVAVADGYKAEEVSSAAKSKAAEEAQGTAASWTDWVKEKLHVVTGTTSK